MEVITGGEAANQLSDTVNAAGLPEGTQSALNASLAAAATSFDKGNFTAGVNQLRAFQNKVRAQRGKKIDAATADALIAQAQKIIDAGTGT